MKNIQWVTTATAEIPSMTAFPDLNFCKLCSEDIAKRIIAGAINLPLINAQPCLITENEGEKYNAKTVPEKINFKRLS